MAAAGVFCADGDGGADEECDSVIGRSGPGGTAGKTVTGGRLNVYDALETLIGNQAPLGAVEVANGTVVSGWAFDFNLGQGATTDALNVDNKFVATTAANGARPDLVAQLGSSNHGFSFSLGDLSLGSHKVDVYVTDSPGGGLVLLGEKTITVAPGALS